MEPIVVEVADAVEETFKEASVEVEEVRIVVVEEVQIVVAEEGSEVAVEEHRRTSRDLRFSGT